ncbi:MAG: hypothetical protein GX685_00145 [Clostridiales bacterium]|jgi:hypothetical protein|nr:hypothetical protein [Clostridiales bacterium]
MGMNIDNECFNDFKYEMNDLTVIYYGAKYSYQEIIDDKVTSFKLKRIIVDWILPEVSGDTTLESHFYYLKPEDRSYLVYDQLKVKLRCSIPYEKKSIFGKTEKLYKEEIISLKDMVQMTPSEKKEKGIIIREIQISKVGLMSFTL